MSAVDHGEAAIGADRRPLATLLALIADIPAGRRARLLALIVAGAATESIGLFTLVPMLAVMDGAGAGAALAQLLPVGFSFDLGLPALLALFVLLILLRGLLAVALGRAQLAEQYGVIRRLSRRCFAALIHAEWRWLTTQHGADHHATLLSNVGFAGNGLAFAMNLASGLVLSAATLAVALYLSWQTTLVAVAGGVLIVIALAQLRRRATAQGESVWIAQRDLYRQSQRSLTSVRLVKLFEKEAEETAAFEQAVDAVRAAKMAHVHDGLWANLLFLVSGALLLVLVIGVGVGVWKLSLAVLLPLVLAIARVIPLLTGLHQAWHGWLHAAPSIARVQAMIREGEVHADAHAPDAAPLPLEDAIAVAGVTVTYADRPQPVLDSVSLRLPARTIIAISGPSGAGKTSLVDVITGLIEPDQGQVNIDGVTLTGAARAQWRRSVAYVQQDTILFNASIRDNLLWARAGATDDDLFAALDMAAASFVRDLPQGLGTMIGDNGLRLSGGERQRLCLARALLRDPALLILDEATSALDSASERAIRTAIRNLRGQVTCILIGHRSALLSEADMQVEMEQGRVVAVRSLSTSATAPA